jgi:ketosteroid isomerase-like protein
MPNDNEALVREAYEAYARGDLETMLGFVDPELEWTYLDPAQPDPTPQVCHGRFELERVLRGLANTDLRAELEEVRGHEERVMVTVRVPGIAAFRAQGDDDRSHSVLTVRNGRIVALHDCRDRREALAELG